jgi:hypothetical protein
METGVAPPRLLLAGVDAQESVDEALDAAQRALQPGAALLVGVEDLHQVDAEGPGQQHDPGDDQGELDPSGGIHQKFSGRRRVQKR